MDLAFSASYEKRRPFIFVKISDPTLSLFQLLQALHWIVFYSSVLLNGSLKHMMKYGYVAVHRCIGDAVSAPAFVLGNISPCIEQPIWRKF